MYLHIWIFIFNLTLIAQTGFCDSFTIRPFIRSKYSQRWNRTTTVPSLILMDTLANTTSERNSTERPFVLSTTVSLNVTTTVEPQQNSSLQNLLPTISINSSQTSFELYERNTTATLYSVNSTIPDSPENHTESIFTILNATSTVELHQDTSLQNLLPTYFENITTSQTLTTTHNLYSVNSTLPDSPKNHTENVYITLNTTETQLLPEEQHEITTTSILQFKNIPRSEFTTKDQRENEIIDTYLSSKPLIHKKQHLPLQQNQFSTPQSFTENMTIPTLGDYDYY